MAGADKDLVLGYDFGTSALKAALLDRSGRIVANMSAPYPLLLPARGCAEQRPKDWWNAMAGLTPRLLSAASAEPARVAALAVSAQMCGVVPVDEHGEALSNCLIWLDTRSSAIARRLVKGWIKISGYGVANLVRWLRLTGGAPNLSGKDPPSKMLWLRENEPAVWRRTHKLLDVADYIVHHLTGRFVTSFDRAHLTWLFDARAGHKHWSPALLSRVGLDRTLLPEVLGASDIGGGLRGQSAQALGLHPETPVAVGLGDVAAAALASGTKGLSAPHLNIGTSSWLGANVARKRVDPLTGIGSICGADGGDYLLIATQENAGACIAWALEALGFAAGEYTHFEAEAQTAEPRLDAPLFFPWLGGERVPVDDKHLRGGFLNLSLADKRGSLARAVYEGVALNMRWAMDDFDRLGACAGKPLRVVGGGAASALWCQIFADVLGRELETVELTGLSGARGAAMTAAVAAKWFPDLSAASATVKAVRSFAPNPDHAALYQERYRRFVAGHSRLGPWYNRFADGGQNAKHA